MDQPVASNAPRLVGIGLITFAVAFNLPYAWLAARFDYPDTLRSPPGMVLAAFADGGAPLVFAWAAFALAALLFAPVAVGVAMVNHRSGHPASEIAALGIAAGVTQAIGLSRWVYAVPGLAAGRAASADDAGLRASIETTFSAFHQFAGVGVGEAIGQSLTAFWLIGVAIGQRGHPRFGTAVAGLGMIGGLVLLLGLVEGLATVVAFDPGVFGLAGVAGFLVLTVWMIWTGVVCIARADATA
jgi:hypothetical protein